MALISRDGFSDMVMQAILQGPEGDVYREDEEVDRHGRHIYTAEWRKGAVWGQDPRPGDGDVPVCKATRDKGAGEHSNAIQWFGPGAWGGYGRERETAGLADTAFGPSMVAGQGLSAY